MNNLLPYNFCFETSLYLKVEINSSNREDLLDLLQFNGTIEGYNPNIKQETTYRFYRNNSYNSLQRITLYEARGPHEFTLTCVRTNFQIKIYTALLFHEKEEDETEYVFMKIGQYPSIADLHISKIKNYDKVLEQEKLKEITRAVGLNANGVGIGAFVYLRRVFEFLIEEAHQIALRQNNWQEPLYASSRMNEKIGLLKDLLPQFLVDNKNMYGILSMGIHSLTEQECLKYFDAVKVGIELILDEKLEKLNKEKKVEEAKKKLQAIEQNVKKL